MLPPVGPSDFSQLLTGLEQAGMLSITGAKKDENEVKGRRVMIEAEETEVIKGVENISILKALLVVE